MPILHAICALLWFACARWASYAYRAEREVRQQLGVVLPGAAVWLCTVVCCLLMAVDHLASVFPTVPRGPILGQCQLVVLASLLTILVSRLRFNDSASDRAQLGFACWLVSLLIRDVAAAEGWLVIAERCLQMIGTLALVSAIRDYVGGLLSHDHARQEAPSLRTSVGSLILVVGLLLLTWTGVNRALAVAETASQERPRWFQDLVAPEIEVVNAIGEELRAGLVGGNKPESSQVLDAWRQPIALFVTTTDGKSRGTTRFVIAPDARQAVTKILGKMRGQEPVTHAGIRVDVVGSVQELEFGDDDPEPESDVVVPGFKRGIHGLALERSWGLAFSPGQVRVSNLVSARERHFDRDVLRGFLDEDSEAHAEAMAAVESGLFSIYRFETSSAYYTSSSRVALFRGHRMFESLQPNELMTAATAGGEYLTRAVGDDGEFLYSYDASLDEVLDRYNMLRHAGTVYSMLELYEAHPDPALLQAAQRALDYMDDRIGIDPHDDGETDVLVDGDSIKVGGNALAAIAICKYMQITGDRSGLETLKRVCQWLLNHIDSDGQFAFHKRSYETGEVSDFVSDYYPGEAVLALVRTHELDPDERWLDGAERVARYLIENRDAKRSSEELPHDHWLLYALNELQRQRPDPIYLSHARRIVDSIVAAQRLDPRIPDWVGSYDRPPRTTPTATRSEGLCAGYALEKDFGSPARARIILAAIRRGVRFQLQTQLREESVVHVPNPRKAMGGFHRSLDHLEIRIDYVQHNISAILQLRQILQQ